MLSLEAPPNKAETFKINLTAFLTNTFLNDYHRT